jgi:branched-chain amino acid aminotransferase
MGRSGERRERYVLIDGELVPESKATISVFDRGFLWGDGVYEVTPVFRGRPFRLEAHVDRLYRSLRYVQIDPGMTAAEMVDLTLVAHEANLPMTEDDPVVRLCHYVTRGLDQPSMAARHAGPATVVAMWRPVDPAWYRTAFTSGVEARIVPTQRNRPAAVEPRAKVTSKLNQILAELDADVDGAISIMLDEFGNLAENSVANVFLVRDGRLQTPRMHNVLEGVTQQATFDYADQLGIPWSLEVLSSYDIAQADEIFVTSSAFGALPVRKVGRFVPQQPTPGPITRAIQSAMADEVGVDLPALARESD